jgi:Arc/MetJ-type ribon-helix-helix transcriptional regulator
MAINLKPETERLVQEEIRSGRFQSADELIVKAVHAWREKQSQPRIPRDSRRAEAVDRALAFATKRAIPLDGVSIRELVHERHRV